MKTKKIMAMPGMRGQVVPLRRLAPLAIATSLFLSQIGGALAADECGAGTIIVCDDSGNPYTGGVIYTGSDVHLTLASGAVVDTTGSAPTNSATTTVGFATGTANGAAAVAGNLGVTIEDGARIVVGNSALTTGQMGVLMRDQGAGSNATLVNDGEIDISGLGSEAMYVDVGGAIDIIARGTVSTESQGGRGIKAVANAGGTGDMTINHSGTIAGASTAGGGINAQMNRTGNISIVQTGSIDVRQTAISVGSNGSGAATYEIDNRSAIIGDVTGIYVDGGRKATITNSGDVTSVGSTSGGSAIAVNGKGTLIDVDLTNTANVTGSRIGLSLSAANAVVNNSGTLMGTNHGIRTIGLGTLAAGTLTLTNSGLIEGGQGVRLGGNGNSLHNTGTIRGTGGTAISIGGDDTLLTLDTGSLLDGDVQSTGANSRLILAGSGSEDANVAGFASLAMNGIDWRLSGSSTFSDTVSVNSGALHLDGASLVTPTLIASSGTTFGGYGTVSGAVTIADGATLYGQQGNALAMDSLQLSGGSIVQTALGMPGSAALFNVNGNLILDGRLEVSDLGGFGPGVYRLFDYGGALTDNGLDITSAPAGTDPADLAIQTAIANQVNLVNSTGVSVQFWDGPNETADGTINGGSGTWDADNRQWTNTNGSANDQWGGQFAIFQGEAGTVLLDDSHGGITATGMQFAVDGYRIEGAALGLSAPESVIRVGDGTADGASITATIASQLEGTGTLLKTDLGRLILTADSSAFAGGASVRGGTLRLDGALGGNITVESGSRLEGTGTAGGVTLTAGSVLAPGGDAGTLGTFTIDGDFVGAGGTVQMDAMLGGDDSSSDRLHIKGNTSGQADLVINNVGGAGAQTTDGIRIVQVDGASSGQFHLRGRAVAGQYEYFVFQGGKADPNDGDWYLRSEYLDPGDPCLTDPTAPECPTEPVLRPEPGVYLANQSSAASLFQHSMHDRIGEPAFDDADRTVWVRTSRSQADFGALARQLDVDSNRSLLQAGADAWVAGDGRLRVGGMLGAGRVTNTATSTLTGYSAKGRVEGYSAGIYATWLQHPAQSSGWYVDGSLQYGKFNNTVEGTALAKERYDARSWSGSIEAGRAFLILDTGDSQVFVQPQMQIGYSHYDADSLVERNGTVVRSDADNGIHTRVGARLYGHATSGATRVQPYLALNWLRGRDDNGVVFDGERLRSDEPKDRYEVKAGAQASLGSGWSGWGEWGARRGQHGYREIMGQLGVKYAW
ncbi:autotransporter outer membrane beta-barrel domain-containing protein [Stenotrophomonas sp. GD04145]|uniref:autotransporter outer membrane beta-barrel domain-containing protein n=1 Tax=Stenotrophomonas sp. GD04145 TaxID=2975436 RepID=UPI00244699A2|nr:autotransporter outer membrane beta-barrel domain-containing protein [Stenotrophomonas sp. GD04145]MDH0169915.1 autotransporter outer membrane beta-barrel domain-containing protein [Stenotrophomonas sp. GD04145]